MHRDIKPENILLASGDPDCTDIKICDFGLAKVKVYIIFSVWREIFTKVKVYIIFSVWREICTLRNENLHTVT